jgi:phosphatidylserine/phosphatidylglycerophosphate/cardiolipin synthase-like enzyme
MAKIEEKMQLLTSKNFLTDLKAEIMAQPQHVKMVFFRLRADKMMEDLMPAMTDALNSGTKVEIYVDAIYSKQILSDALYPSLSRTRKREEMLLQSRTKELYRELSSLGAEVRFCRQPYLINNYILPFAQRDHRKVVIIKRKDNSGVAFFGASNMDDGERNDYMIKCNDPSFIKILKFLGQYTDRRMPDNDLAVQANKDVKFYLDAGKPFRSMIFSHAINMINNAKNQIIFASQLPPEPALLYPLVKAAKKGIDIEIILPEKKDKSVSSFPYSMVYKFASQISKKYGIKIHHSSKGFIHAKILIVDELVLVGSHNLSYAGVVAGTVELSAEIKDKRFVVSVYEFLNSIR